MAANQAELPVHAMCKYLKVSAGGYYDRCGRVLSKRAAANVTLLAQIEAAHVKSDATYGMPCIRVELADQGIVISRKRIASAMRLASIRGVSRRRGCQKKWMSRTLERFVTCSQSRLRPPFNKINLQRSAAYSV